MGRIKDFIYFDLEKAISLLSQLDGKLITQINEEVEESSDERKIRNYDLMLFKPEFGGVKNSKSSSFQSGVLHHNVFNLLEAKLKENSLITYVNDDISEEDKECFLVNYLKNKYYIIVEGYVNIEDFDKVSFITQKYPSITEFIQQCAMSGIEESEEYQDFMKKIEEKRDEINNITDKNKRRQQNKKLDEQIHEFNKILKTNAKFEDIPGWLLEGIQLFIETFLPNRIMIRIYPYMSRPENHFIGNLKRHCFIDDDIDNIINAYGTRPNIQLTMFGLITSMPEKEGSNFDPLDEYLSYEEEIDKNIAFEKAFREVFRALEGIEGFVKFSRYPNITVYPIAIYRNIG